jgi:multimeric flavodoxin WrbA
MKTLLIVYYSMTGGTLQMAHAAAAGARAEQGVEVSLRCASDAHAADVLGADGYIFATPENLGSVAGMMKDFFDRTYYPVLDRINGRAYLSLICAGSDGRSAALQIDRIAAGWRLKSVADPLIVCTRAQTPEQILAPKRIDQQSLARCAELGRTMAAGLSVGIF